MMNYLQKIVVLCVVLALGVLIGMKLTNSIPAGELTTQIYPPALDIDTSHDGVEGIDGKEPAEAATPTPDNPEPDLVACTADAKMCPDGSFVGRTGPNCEFSACPTATAVVCTDAQKQAQLCTREYRPVCGLVEVQCITTPCNPIPETFSNACEACRQGNVISYTSGQCEV